jgi:hypothetical protein
MSDHVDHLNRISAHLLTRQAPARAEIPRSYAGKEDYLAQFDQANRLKPVKMIWVSSKCAISQ